MDEEQQPCRPGIVLLCLHPGCGHPLAAQLVIPGSHESPMWALGAAPGSFLRLPSQENATAEEGPAAAAWRELQALHPDVACQDQGRHWVSIWVPVSELQVSLYGFGVLGLWVLWILVDIQEVARSLCCVCWCCAKEWSACLPLPAQKSWLDLRGFRQMGEDLALELP